jgi:hypothetical protein
MYDAWPAKLRQDQSQEHDGTVKHPGSISCVELEPLNDERKFEQLTLNSQKAGS